ncbi:enoyl-CoA hydratase/isomerase family protein [Burkholderia ambifaria]|uniref:enoyl-CoA hydratase/isomerase family protein n=1 Tax=Burkholderia ambifaria TaxID=152480 RepID=UPI001B90C3BB|nr:enoyl-CoA hydratase/isomerase family protein [Burkholderia ambifaria]MBR8257220.1 enoyl-CoA hydratase/isomerase family protein [Burkholderia ambifaria]
MGKVSFEVEDKVAVVKFTNPDKGFMDFDMLVQLGTVMDTLEADPGVRAIVFTGGQPEEFIRHVSVEDLIAYGELVRAGHEAGLPDPLGARSPLRAAWEKIERSQKPTIAAINGYCMGGGLEVALCCDIRIAGSGTYTLGQPEIQVGLITGAGASVRLARAVGTGKALEWMLRGRLFYPEEAAKEGLVHHYVTEDVVIAAKRMASEFLDKPAAALSFYKQLVRSSEDQPIAESMDREAAAFVHLLAHDKYAIQMMKDYVAGGHKLKKI